VSRGPESDSAPPGRAESRPSSTPPFGTSQRIRTRAIWAVALFAASVPPAFVGFGIAQATSDQANVATPLAFAFWAIGLLFALWAAFPTLRYWDGLPNQIRWLGALPLLSVSLFVSAALIGTLLV
jgi:hypothetical protein